MTISTRLAKLIDWFYIPAVHHVMPKQTFRYAACGGMNMVVDTLLYYIAFHYVFLEENLDLGFVVISPHIAALVIVFPITLFNGFWLNRNVAFKHSPVPHGKQLVRYLISVAGAFLINYLCMKLFVDVLNIYPTPSKMLSTAVTTIYSYTMQKHYTFKGCSEL